MLLGLTLLSETTARFRYLGKSQYEPARRGNEVPGRWLHYGRNRVINTGWSASLLPAAPQGTNPCNQFAHDTRGPPAPSGLAKPVFEQHITTRGPDDFHRLATLARLAESMIAAEHFAPNEQGFTCAGCPYQTACRAWHRETARAWVPLHRGHRPVRRGAARHRAGHHHRVRRRRAALGRAHPGGRRTLPPCPPRGVCRLGACRPRSGRDP